jgi:hypothetical protein
LRKCVEQLTQSFQHCACWIIGRRQDLVHAKDAALEGHKVSERAPGIDSDQDWLRHSISSLIRAGGVRSPLGSIHPGVRAGVCYGGKKSRNGEPLRLSVN